MPYSSVELPQICEKVIAYANQSIQHSTTSFFYSELSSAEQTHIAEQLETARLNGRKHINQINLSRSFLDLDFDHDLFLFNRMLESAKTHQVGNCDELACLALEYIVLNHPGLMAEIVEVCNGDHVILVLNRNPEQNLENPETLSHVFFCDPLEKRFYEGTEYLKQLKTYDYTEQNDQRKIVCLPFDPKKHALSLRGNINSHFMWSFNQPSGITELKTFFYIKGFVLRKFLQAMQLESPTKEKADQTFLNGTLSFLKEIQDGLEKIMSCPTTTSYHDLKKMMLEALNKWLAFFEKFLCQRDAQKEVSQISFFQPSVDKLSEPLRENLCMLHSLWENFLGYERDFGMMLSLSQHTKPTENNPLETIFLEALQHAVFSISANAKQKSIS